MYLAAEREKRVILTFDRDYGELLFRHRLGRPRGVIYFRYDPATPEEPGQHLHAASCDPQSPIDNEVHSDGPRANPAKDTLTLPRMCPTDEQCGFLLPFHEL